LWHSPEHINDPSSTTIQCTTINYPIENRNAERPVEASSVIGWLTTCSCAVSDFFLSKKKHIEMEI
jgi:hypothetical protein